MRHESKLITTITFYLCVFFTTDLTSYSINSKIVQSFLFVEIVLTLKNVIANSLSGAFRIQLSYQRIQNNFILESIRSDSVLESLLI